ncbi:hypothetical protein NCS52_01350700 [Fusarium sp. LHS14.1]|nr:hypothetical protein NCS52_01350700 [Fusarium sp. LHS14.1]
MSLGPSIPPSLIPIGASAENEVVDDNQQSPNSFPLSPQSSISPYGFGFPLSTREEARYLMHYVQELAPWVDITDPAQSFALEVPKRARQFPLQAYSILAFSSRHLVLMTGKECGDTERYYSCALRILIPILDDSEASINENLLAAVVLLRLYEEMTEVDAGIHPQGGSRLLNDVSNFAARGGLGEAASWIVLRQDLHVSLIKSEPMRVNLSSYEHSKSFEDPADETITNRAVLLCCRVLTAAFGGLDTNSWARLSDEIAQWHDDLPAHYRPHYCSTGIPDSKTGSVFPVVWLTHPAHVLGFQHYHLARMFLQIFEPRIWLPSLHTVEERLIADRTALNHLRMAIGLAIHNVSVVGATFTAHHVLYACGIYFGDATERREVLSFLDRMSTSIGWPTGRLQAKLNQVWFKNDK